MKTLVLCLDRDDDLGRKAGVASPVIGRVANIEAATRLAVADPEDSDVNSIFGGIEEYDRLIEAGVEAEIVSIAGDYDVGVVSDSKIASQIDDLLSRHIFDNVILVSDGAEDEAVLPIVESRIKINSVKRIRVKQSESIESTYYLLKEFISDPKVRSALFIPIGLACIAYAASSLINRPELAVAAILGTVGTYLLYNGFGVGQSIDKYRENATESLYRGRISFVTYLAAILIGIIATIQGADACWEGLASDIFPGYVILATIFMQVSVWWYVAAGLFLGFGKIIDLHLEKKPIGRAWAFPSFVIATGLLLWSTSAYILATTGIYPDYGIQRLMFSIVGAVVIALIGIYVASRNYREMHEMLILIILDGFGLSESRKGNAIAHAKTPNLDALLERYPTCTLQASGEAVGLPEGQMGNSEVGHLNIGAGRVVYQDLTRINKAISDKTFFRTPVLLRAIEHVKTHDSCLHLMGLVSDGGVHSHITHLLALIELASANGVRTVVHAFLDGRDVPPRSALEYMSAVDRYKGCRIGTVMGRYYAMDRDNRWERVEKAYRALVSGEGVSAESAAAAVTNAYERGENDEFVLPTVVNGSVPIADNDSIIFFNFRPDRAREITRSFVNLNFDHFERKKLVNLYFACMTEYDATIDADVAYAPEEITNTLGEVISKQGLRQLRIAETEKYAHVTFFFNGGVETPNPGEDRYLIPSPKVATYDLLPEMSAYEVTDAVIERIESNDYDVIILNYANCDMVGHTGIFEAAVTAVETVDRCVGRVIDAVQKSAGSAIITADHGNAEEMADEDGTPHTAHTTNSVPLILVTDPVVAGVRDGKLADIAPTMLELLGQPKPPEMTGESIVR